MEERFQKLVLEGSLAGRRMEEDDEFPSRRILEKPHTVSCQPMTNSFIIERQPVSPKATFLLQQQLKLHLHLTKKLPFIALNEVRVVESGPTFLKQIL